MQHNKRPSLSSFPIPFDHPLTIPTLAITVAASAILYHYLQWTHTTELIEAVRKREIKKRRVLKRPEDRYASLKVERYFVNPFDEWQNPSLIETTWFWLRRWKGNGLPRSHEVIDLERNERQSTCLISLHGLAILTVNDYVGPKRLRPVPSPLKEFKDKLDIVLISHDHFDHLDENVVYELGNSVTWYIPLGLRDWFLKRKVENFVEMDWWQEIRHSTRPDIMIACVPAMHWSGSRTPFEKNGTLCGDTGYSQDLYQAIGDLYAPFTLAAIPIGSFKPKSLMQCVHISPEEAIQVHEDLKMPRLSVGVHWGTFMMSEEHYMEAPRSLARLWEQRHPSLKHVSSADPQSSSPDDSTTTSSSTLSNNSSNPSPSNFITTAFGETIVL
ncbi:Metallo-hydrolase/oxidoreductase [Hesseltinella vesiculosa]|uniref:Metallo-hydrolase/oxidoreductase n=1 Tax=Hesseltinella vesiculosa TaxID=101127 RepID=A0A1X2GWW5_9FUNG|nr:Metallo-hydrolase/oxidoreductase [Hesseltinella vesiculosa]